MSRSRKKSSVGPPGPHLLPATKPEEGIPVADARLTGNSLLGTSLTPFPDPLPFLEKPQEISSVVPSAPHYHGHRERLRQRFLTAGPEGFQDYELLELILFYAIPRRDVKPLAKSLLTEFGSLWGVLNAPRSRLQSQFKLGGATLALLSVIAATNVRMAKQKIMNRPILGTWEGVLEYCQALMAHEPVEQFRILFLDRKNVLIADELQQRGTVDQTSVYPREILKRTLELGASSIILVHNHPSGDSTPSQADIDMTRQIVKIAESLGIQVHDHIVVGKGQCVSLRNMGLI